jgi:hypothetical protein
MRKSGANTVPISSVTRAELVYGARLRKDNPCVMSALRAFLARGSVHLGDAAAAEAHARIHIFARG